MTVDNVVLIAAGTLTALVAGLFFSFSFATNLGLARLRDVDYLAAMQSINLTIINPLFLLSFLGPVVLLPLATILHADETDSGTFILLLAASIAYLVGGFGVTVAGNIPLNRRLATVDLGAATPEDVAAVRSWFEGPWNRWHRVRALATGSAVILLFAGCLTT